MRLKTRNTIYNAAIAALMVTAMVSGAALLGKLAGAEKNLEVMSSLAAVVDSAAAGPAGRKEGGDAAGAPPDTGREEPVAAMELYNRRKERLAGYAELKEQNPDLAGWVTIPGTPVDYPVMERPDEPGYYLTHDFNGKRSSYGVPYLERGESPSSECGGAVIYSHHMRDGRMFASLMNYTDKEYYEEHPFIWFDTVEEVGRYRIIGVMKASAIKGKSDIFRLMAQKDSAGCEAYADAVKKCSFYDTGTEYVYGSPLVTLVTCEYSQKEGRLLVVAAREPCGAE